MTVIEKAIMPNGTDIQLENWSNDLCIGAYPTAQRTSKYRWVEGGKKFRLSIAQNLYSGYSNDDVKADFEALKAGKKGLESLAPHFWDGKKDMWYLGMNVENKDY